MHSLVSLALAAQACKNILCYTRYSIVQKLGNKQSAKDLATVADNSWTNNIISTCNTFTPQIKGKCHCINVILHWLWNVNEIYTLISVRM